MKYPNMQLNYSILQCVASHTTEDTKFTFARLMYGHSVIVTTGVLAEEIVSSTAVKAMDDTLHNEMLKE